MDQNLANLMKEYTKYLKPIQGFTNDTMKYEDFAAPFKAQINEMTNQQKPWYDYFTANPQKNQLRNTMAAGGASRTGWGKNLAQRTLREIYQPLDTQIDQTKQNYMNNYVNPLYRQRIEKYYQSPTTGTNYNNF